MSESATTRAGGDRLSRRRFLVGLGKGFSGAVLFSAALGVYSRKASSLPAQALRPPGALPEEDFLAACIRCGLCARDCPYDILHLARLGSDLVPTGTPYFVAREKPCEMCTEIHCMKACPTGALNPALGDIDDARMGLAVLYDQETCLNYQGQRCEICYRSCPVIDKAITLEPIHVARIGMYNYVPIVHSDRCTGCGKCEANCPLEIAAIKVFPVSLTKGGLAGHLRFGREEGVVYETPVFHLPETGEKSPGAIERLNRGLEGQ